MKKVLFVANKLCGGGAEKVVTLLSNALSKDNVEVKIITYKNETQSYKINDRIECETINSKRKNKFVKKIDRILKLRKEIKQYSPDAVIAFEYFVNMQVILATLGLKTKVIVSERNDPNNVGNKKGIKQLRDFLYKFADVLVCQTEGAKLYFKKEIQDKTKVIPNPITPNLPNKYEGNRRKEIVNFCRIEPQKNLKLLIDAFELLNKEYGEYRLTIYGEGKQKEELKKYILDKKMDQSATINDFTLDIHSRIIDCAMFVSSSDYEGISNSMLEAMGIGLPTICTDCPCGGARMMIENNVNGILVPTRDVQSLYKAMKRVIENPDFAKKLSENAIKINDELEQGKICNKWLELI